MIEKDKVVSIHYTLTDGEGNVLDSSKGGEPLAYLHGHRNIIPGLEAALERHEAGEHLDVVVEPEQAYGPWREELLLEVPRSELPEGFDVPEGEMVRAQAPDGRVEFFTVRENRDDAVVFDGNHPLAGKRLHFSVDIVDVRAATPEELAHGHVHGPGGHHH